MTYEVGRVTDVVQAILNNVYENKQSKERPPAYQEKIEEPVLEAPSALENTALKPVK